MAKPIEVQFMMWTRGIHETIIRWELRFPYVKVHFWQGHTVEHAQICLWSIYSDLAACSLPAITAVTHTRLMALFLGLPGWASTWKVKPIWTLLNQETVSGSGISWDVCKSAPHTRQITMPAPHRSVFYRPDALPAAQTTVSKHWRQHYCSNL